MEIHVCGRLDAFALADHLNIPVLSIDNISLPQDQIEHLKGQKKGFEVEWHAATVPFEERQFIIHNTGNSLVRQQSDIMHELAHVICKHQHKNIHLELPWYMRSYNPQYEAEAEYLGATLQITRAGLLWKLKSKTSIENIAEYYNASVDMVRFRIAQTGANKVFHKKILSLE
jgi:Zn-dependent peptidase ImmA (M78 family)